MRNKALHSSLRKQIDYSNSPEVVSTDFVGSRPRLYFRRSGDHRQWKAGRAVSLVRQRVRLQLPGASHFGANGGSGLPGIPERGLIIAPAQCRFGSQLSNPKVVFGEGRRNTQNLFKIKELPC